MKAEFRPPRESAWITRAMQGVLPLMLRARGVDGVTVDAAGWAHLESLRGHRALLTANHPTTNDPLIAFHLSRRLGEPFNYLACRELFRGPYGWLIQRVGAYSILRGAADRESLRTTRRLLAEEDRKIVIFPEAETYEHNDLTIPFLQGPVQMGFWALEDLEKAGRELRLPVLPLAIKYRCLRDPERAVRAGLQRLERTLGARPGSDAPLYERLRHVGEAVLGRLEREYGVSPPAGALMAPRVDALKEHIVTRVAREVGAPRPTTVPLPQQMRALFNAVTDYLAVEKAPDTHAQRGHARRLAVADLCQKDLQRLQNFLVVTDGYVAERRSAERFLDVLGRLEREVYGEVRTRVAREALVHIAPPLELGERYAEYRREKRQTVEGVTAEIEARIRSLLSTLADASTPVKA